MNWQNVIEVTRESSKSVQLRDKGKLVEDGKVDSSKRGFSPTHIVI